MASSSPPQVKALNCPNCGAGLQVRTYARTINVVCVNCLSVLDASSPELQILQKFQAAERIQPLIPLGSRGKLEGDPWEAIGFQVRQITVEDVPYEWHEYLLCNPFKGYRYLTQFDGHWNDVKILKTIPTNSTAGGRPAKKLLGVKYRHFQTSVATTTYVMGEFPWQVRVGETATVMDYVAPPFMLSSEETESEVTWSLGEYTEGAKIYQSFGIKESPPAPKGVFANQPAPKSVVGRAWRTWLVLNVALFALMFGMSVFSSNAVVFDNSYDFTSATKGEASFVTETFDLKGRTSNVELDISTDLENDWAYFNFALINETTSQAFDFGREAKNYHGSDEDGTWSEGGKRDSVVIPSVPSGRYYLRVEPEMENTPEANHTMNYHIQLRRDVPYNTFFWIAALILLIPPIFRTFRGSGFEAARWRESDYGTNAGGG